MNIKFEYFPENQVIDSKDLELFKNIIQNPNTQFFNTISRTELIAQSKLIYKKFSTKKNFIHIGIGGSSLGPEMLYYALNKNDRKFVFINNIDPDEIFDQLKDIDFNQSLFYFVSKSGGTAETLAALAIISQKLFDQGVSPLELNQFFVFATDPSKSELLDLGKKFNIDCLSIPSDVGGRFSILTPVGFLPALFCGIDIDQLITGAKDMAKICLEDSQQNPLLKTTAFFLKLLKEENINQTVMMPYSSKLKYFSFWFTQLWAESLGKKLDQNAKEVFCGLTPIPAYGATDQHSQMQLFMEGPKDKALILIETLNFSHDFALKSILESTGLKKLSHHSLSELLKAELYGTMKALKVENRPFIHMAIDKNDESHLGALILFFESLTALMGYKLNVDPFNQPGVEAGKIYAYEYLTLLK